jgi:toxin HigB-1
MRLLWEHGNGSRLPAEHISRIERMLDVIDSAKTVPNDFEPFKNWHIHQLSGVYKDFRSVKVNKNYRIIFRFDGQDAHDLDYIDYH